MNESQNGPPSWIRSRSGLILLVFLGIAGFFLISEHRAHVFGVLPYLLLLACPLMHFFHRGHKHGPRHGDRSGSPPPPDSRP
jgi:Protein of unknown function (DUF2933)